MRIETYVIPAQLDELALRDWTAVVIDVLRASTSVITALSSGAREVIPAATVESAMKIAGNLGPDQALLGGERNGKMIPGFDLGNSPSEYASPKVRGKSIIFSSTNGSQAMMKGRYASGLVICGFVNLSAVASHLAARSGDVAILCSGQAGRFAIEDMVCAGMLIARVSDDNEVQLSDGALAAVSLYRTFGRGILKMMRASEHGKFLEELGFSDDVKACAKVDAVPVVPVLEGNVIRLRRETASASITSTGS
jgi:2-phosphosulfolactate phosphatase